MTLLDALREIAPVEGSPRVRARRSEAARIVYTELHELAGKMWRGAEPCDREDVASTVLVRLMRNGPHGPRIGAAGDDDAARAYLRAAMRNGLTSIARSNQRLAAEVDPPADEPGPEDETALREARQRVAALERELFDELAPRIAGEMRAGAVFLATVQRLRDLRDRRVTMEELVGEEMAGTARGETEYRRARNRLDQRFSRVFARFDEEIEALRESRRVGAERAAELRIVLDSLRLRQ